MIFSFEQLQSDLRLYQHLKVTYRMVMDGGLLKVMLFSNGTFLKNLYYATDKEIE